MKKLITFISIISLSIFSSCKTEEIALPDNLAGFEASEQGMDAATKDLTIKIKLNRAAEAASTIAVQLVPTGLTYGTEFTTNPAATNNILSIPVALGATEASIVITKAANVFLNGSEKLELKINSITAPALVGTNANLAVKFTAIVSEGTALKLNGGAGGASAVNSVFVDFSNNSQTSVARAAWDLAFFGGNDFRVRINNFTAATGIATTKTDINAVGSADTTGKDFSLTFLASQLPLVDDVQGVFTKTVIAQVSATEADNKVYIINRGTGGATPKKDMIKVRILRNGANYTLQYAGLTETTFKSVTITKNPAYNFNFFSITNNAMVDVEPAKAKWDIVWSGGIFQTQLSATEIAPYYFSDQVYINHLAGVSAAEVLTSTVTYDAFGEGNIAAQTFLTERSAIGSKWRITSGTPIGVKTDRFYVVKDASGNVYKLKFLNFHSADGGERGYPNIEYKLVKKG
jgi:HmuY protein